MEISEKTGLNTTETISVQPFAFSTSRQSSRPPATQFENADAGKPVFPAYEPAENHLIMFQRRSSVRSSGSRSSITAKQPRGLFENGIWHCDCMPRLPAERFQVKKESKNQGRWFYTCQKPSEKRCGFFLWDDDAKARSGAAVLHNSRTEPSAQQDSARSTDRDSLTYFSANSISKDTSNSVSPPKRKLPWLEYPEEVQTSNAGSGYSFNSDLDDAALSTALEETERSAGSSQPFPDTPRKAAKTTSMGAPGREGLGQNSASFRAGGLPTPDTTPQTKRTRVVGPVGQVDGADDTPTPSRFRDALSGAESSVAATLKDEDLSEKVLVLLNTHNVQLSPPATTDLRALLDRETLRVRGIVRGRDVARTAIATRDRSINEKNIRIIELETEKETLEGVVAALRARLNGTGGSGPDNGGRKGMF